MRIVEKCWVDLSTGYKTALSLEARLKSEWQRAIQVVERREDLTLKAKSARIRNIAGIVFLVLLLVCVLFWIGTYYVPERRIQFLVSLCVLTVPAMISGAFYLFQLNKWIVRSRPLDHPSLKLVESWWELLRQKRYVIGKHGHKGEVDFLKSLDFLNNDYIAVWGLLTSAKIASDTDVLLLGPNGIWVFEVKYWSGTISKHDGVWAQEKKYFQKGGLPAREKVPHQSGPDEQWLNQKNEIAKTLKLRLPSKVGLSEMIKGGIVFAHQNVSLGQIAHPAAAYGKTGAWHRRIKETKPINGFTMDDRLQVLDALVQYANLHEREMVKIVSASKSAERLYKEVSSALREYVSTKLK